jgi:hypothetical protein
VLEFSRIHEIRVMRHFVEMLRERVGAPLSLASIARDLQVSPTTLTKYLDILEALYVVFTIRPLRRNVARAILKVARLVPAGGRLDVAVASFHHEGRLAARVDALVGLQRGRETASTRGLAPGLAPRGPLVRVALGMAVAGALAGSLELLAALHGALERLVHLLA